MSWKTYIHLLEFLFLMYFYNMGLICESRFLLSYECNSEKRKLGARQCQEDIPHARALFYFEADWMDFLSHTLG